MSNKSIKTYCELELKAIKRYENIVESGKELIPLQCETLKKIKSYLNGHECATKGFKPITDRVEALLNGTTQQLKNLIQSFKKFKASQNLNSTDLTILKKAFGISSNSIVVIKASLQQYKPTSNNTNKTNEEILTEIQKIQRNAFSKENNPSIIGNLKGGKKKKKGIERKPAKSKPAKRKPTGKKKVRKIHKGPRGGRYYISKGKKVYL